MSFALVYKQRAEITSDYSPDFGNNWGCPLVSYVAVESSLGVAALVLGGGGIQSYVFNPGESSVRGRDGEWFSQITPGSWDHGFRLEDPDKSAEVFGFAVRLTSGLNRFYLSQIVDPLGRITQINHVIAESHVQLLSVTDSDSKTSTFEYDDSAHPNRITRIVTPYSRQAILVYSGDHLSGIRDMQDIASSFEYADPTQPDLVTAMITPYGRTTFTSFTQPAADNVPHRSIHVIHPDGGQERVQVRARQ